MKQEKEKKELTEEERKARNNKIDKTAGGCCIAVGIFVVVFRLITLKQADNIGTLIGGILAGVIAIVIGIVLEIKAKK